jgi:CubicO group peptidase (beta-lactamase class C family)
VSDSAPPSAEALGLGQSSSLDWSQRVDASNWTLAPYNRWSFQRVQQFTRTARVTRSAAPSALPVKHLDVEALTFTDSSGEKSSVRDLLQRTWTDGFMVLHQGSVIAEQYFNGMRADTLHLMMSCSKSMTSALVGVAVAEGQLELERKLSHYIPELIGTGFDGAKLQQALDMRVGLDFNEDYSDLDADWRTLELATGWRQPSADYKGPTDAVGYMQTLTGSVGPHGDVFHYQSILTDVVGVCLERATGRSFLELFEEVIWHPMGAEHDLISIIDSAGTAVFEGGFNCCLRDFSRFAQLICDGGVAQGKQLVPTAWIDQCRFADKELLRAFSESEYGEVMPDHAYHNKWWIRDSKRGVIMALGIHGQTLFIDPEQHFVVAKFSSQPMQDDLTMALDQALGFEAIRDYLVGR